MIYDGAMPDIYVKRRYKKEEYLDFDIEVVKLEDGYTYAQALSSGFGLYFYTRARSAEKARKELKKHIEKLSIEVFDRKNEYGSNIFTFGN